MSLCPQNRWPWQNSSLPWHIPEGAKLIAWPKGQSLACSVPGHQLERRGFPSPGTLSPEQNLFLSPGNPPHEERHRGLCWWRDGPAAREVPRKRAAHAVCGPQPSPQPRLRVQIPRRTPVSRASPLHRRIACSLRRKRCDCAFISPAVCPRSPAPHSPGLRLWPLQAPERRPLVPPRMRQFPAPQSPGSAASDSGFKF